jgi:hypothetical protein
MSEIELAVYNSLYCRYEVFQFEKQLRLHYLYVKHKPPEAPEDSAYHKDYYEVSSFI